MEGATKTVSDTLIMHHAHQPIAHGSAKTGVAGAMCQGQIAGSWMARMNPHALERAANGTQAAGDSARMTGNQRNSMPALG